MPQQRFTSSLIVGSLALAALVQLAAAVITVQIGGATRLSSLSRQRDRYNCYWDCDLVGCNIAHDDDECAYDCEKICRVRYDYAAARSELKPKSSAADALASLAGKSSLGGEQPAPAAAAEPAAAEPDANNDIGANPSELVGTGTSVRLHLPRNASARNFAIWESCSQDSASGKLNMRPFNL